MKKEDIYISKDYSHEDEMDSWQVNPIRGDLICKDLNVLDFHSFQDLQEKMIRHAYGVYYMNPISGREAESRKLQLWSSWESVTPKENVARIFKAYSNRLIKDLRLKITLNEKEVAELDSSLGNLYNEIEKSKYILNLGDDFDDEGSIGYSEETWEKAIKFICWHYQSFYENVGIALAPPKIYHGPNGTIDLYWKSENKSVLLNIPSGEELNATFSASNSLGENVEGNLLINNLQESLLFTIATFI